MARRLQRVSSGDTKVDLPITPMLDMTFQLLAFFLLSFQASSTLEGKMDFTLAAEKTPGQQQDPGPFLPPGLDDETKLTVVVRTLRDGVNDGNISALIVQTPEGPVAVRDLNELRQNLKQRLGETGKAQVQIAAESKLKYGCLMEVMDACVQSGFANVGFTAPPDLGLN